MEQDEMENLEIDNVESEGVFELDDSMMPHELEI